MLDDREALLRAIFDAPDDDTPRLVYADWLDDHGEAAFAELIRLQCAPPDPTGLTFRRFDELLNAVYPRADWMPVSDFPDRGFLRPTDIRVTADELLDPVAFRTRIAVGHPELFAATALKVTDGLIAGGAAFETLFHAPATQKVTAFDLSGKVEPLPDEGVASGGDPRGDTFGVSREYRHIPVITVLGVEALARHRSARRLTDLDLRNNHLDNDAARLLVRSPYLTRLARLDILDGNDLRGDTWAQLLERFGKDVVT